MRLGSILIAMLLIQFCHAQHRPNIVFIMADDLGWADVGYNGAEFYETPNIDQLAADGMRFQQAYTGGPNCLPTRACLISGMYTPRTQIWTPGGLAKGNVKFMRWSVPSRGNRNRDTLPSKLALEPSATSIAEVLKTAGYTTARLGKWHVGPDTQGFDISSSNGEPGVEKKHYGNVNVAEKLTDAGLKFMEQNRERPFFLYLSHWDVHTPIRARKKVVDKYHAKLKSKSWKREWNTTYAAMIEAVDQSVGRIRKKLAELDLVENTLVIFTSDNGGLPRVTTNHPLKGGKGSFFEGGVRIATCMSWPKVIAADSQCNIPITSVDFMPTFAELTDATLPSNQPVDGKSIVPLLKGDKVLENRPIFWHYPLYLSGGKGNMVLPVAGTGKNYWRAVPASMIRKGDWKLIQYFEYDSIRLYNIRNDPSETNDLAMRESEKAQLLLAELKQWQQDVNAVIPTKLNPHYDVHKLE